MRRALSRKFVTSSPPLVLRFASASAFGSRSISFSAQVFDRDGLAPPPEQRDELAPHRKRCASLPQYSALMPANLTTLRHFSISSAMNFPKSAGAPANTAAPRSVRRFSMLGSARAALISLLSFSTISVGVALGTTIPYQPLASKPGRNSPTVGTATAQNGSSSS